MTMMMTMTITMIQTTGFVDAGFKQAIETAERKQ